MRRISQVSLTSARPAFPASLRLAAAAVLGSLALAISAKVQVPFYPVPMTLQTLVVLLIGAAFGARLAAATVALYLLEGAAGLPVFASGAGPAYLAGPTGGFLAGFLLAAFGVGYAAERGYLRSLLPASLVLSLGHLIIFLAGFAWLAFLFGAEKAWMFGVAPFVTATLVKTALAVFAVMLVRYRLPVAGLRWG